MKDISRYCTDRIVDSPFVSEKKIWPAIIAAVGAVASTLLSSSSNASTNKTNKEINEEQIAASEKRLKDEQDYNNFLLNNQKQMQMSDAKQAGLNPAFAQNGQVGGMSSSPNVAIPSMIPMQSMDYGRLGDVGNGIMSALLQGEQAKKVNAEKDLVEAQAVNQKIANRYADRLYKGQADFTESNVQVNGENIAFTRKQCDKISTEIIALNKSLEQMDATIGLIQSQTAVMNEEQKIKFQEALFADKSFNDRLKAIQKQNNLTDAQIDRIKRMTVAEIANLNAQTGKAQAEKGLIEQQTSTEEQRTELTAAQIENTQQATQESGARTNLTKQQTKTEKNRTNEVYWNSKSNKLHFKLDEKYSDAERTIGVAKATAETIEAGANAASNIINIVKP